MRTLDKYITKLFLSNVLFSLVAFTSIFVIVDAVEKLSDYIDRGAPWHVVIEYYLYYVPYIIVLVMPVAMLLASMFSIGQLSKNNELLAMKASGISLYRILAPVFAIGLVFSVLMIYFGEAVVPRANSAKAAIKQTYIDKFPKGRSSQISNLFLQNEDNSRIFIGYYSSYDKTARKISIQYYAGIFITHRIDAEMMQWQNNGWELENVYERFFSDNTETVQIFPARRLDNLVITPEELNEAQKNPEEMSYEEFEKFIAEVRRNGGDPNRWLVDLYLKIAFPFASFIIVLFGAPLASGRVRSSGAIGVALSLFASFFYFGAVKTGQTLGQNGTLSPLFAAWLGNIIFTLFGFYFLWRAPK